MKRFEKAMITLFDSTNANFRLAVEAQFVRGNRETGYRDLVYVTDKASAILNPNIYLTLAYKGEDFTPVYTSYPQLYKLREALEEVKNKLPNAFIEQDGEIFVASNYEEPVIVSNIGKSNNWISLKLAVIKSGENGVTECIPGVSIELSTSNRYTSVLTTDEFLTIYTIVKDLNLINLQCALSLAFLDGQGGVSTAYNTAQPQYQQPSYQPYQQPMYPAPQGQYQQPYQQPQSQQGYIKPRYNQNRAAYTTPQAPVGTQPSRVQPRTVQPTPMTAEESAKADAENWLSKNPKFPEQQNLTPRSAEKPVLNFKNVEETPVSEFDNFDDTDALDDIFRMDE